jgi:hypothetical protein
MIRTALTSKNANGQATTYNYSSRGELLQVSLGFAGGLYDQDPERKKQQTGGSSFHKRRSEKTSILLKPPST